MRASEKGETVGLCFSSSTQTGSESGGGRKPLLGCWVTGSSSQGLAGGLGEGQEPWLSKLAVLAFHCGTKTQRQSFIQDIQQ